MSYRAKCQARRMLRHKSKRVFMRMWAYAWFVADDVVATNRIWIGREAP